MQDCYFQNFPEQMIKWGPSSLASLIEAFITQIRIHMGTISILQIDLGEKLLAEIRFKTYIKIYSLHVEG
jgi:hypothetical protein